MAKETGTIKLRYVGSVGTTIVGYGTFEQGQAVELAVDAANFLLNTGLFEMVVVEAGDKDNLSKDNK